MNIVVKTIDICSIKKIVVVTANENLVAVRQFAEPVEKINRFLLAPDHAEIAGMHYHIRVRQLPKPMMTAVSVREMENFQCCKILESSQADDTSTFYWQKPLDMSSA